MNREELESTLKKLPHKLIVRFAYLCAKDLYKYYANNTYPEVFNARAKCLELIEKWLKDSNSVSEQELNAASDATYTTYTAYYAGRAATAANATDVAYYAANAAIYAASVASTNVEAILQLTLEDLTDLEKELYAVETLMKEIEK